MRADPLTMAARFDIGGRPKQAERLGSGHIHLTWRVVFDTPNGPWHGVLQRLNQQVFHDVTGVMENIRRVTDHMRARLEARGVGDLDRRVMRVVPAREGGDFVRDAQGEVWRLFPYIARTRSIDAVETPDQARADARAFGAFQALLADLPAPRLNETIPDFHHTPRRFENLERAIGEDRTGRLEACRDAVAFALARRDICGRLIAESDAGRIPERITHNDAKINNVLFDEATGEALCVIDLDTVMPGLALYDFGDMVRTATCRAPEDETDLSRIGLDADLFEALAAGYIETAGGGLTPNERANLVFSGRLITFEQGVRFLADHLDGDRYYPLHRPGHNLDRARSQFRLVESIEAQTERLGEMIEGMD